MEYVDTGLKGAHPLVIHDGVYVITPIDKNDEALSMLDKTDREYLSLNCSKFTGEAHQRFIIKYNQKDDYFTIMPLHSFHYLSVVLKKDSDYNNSLVIQFPKSDDCINKWKITFDSNFRIQLKNTDYCFQYNEESNDVKLAKKSKSNSQKFKIKVFDPIKSGLYYINIEYLQKKFILSSKKLYYITFSNDDKSQSSYLADFNKKEDQIFYVIFDHHDGCYSILNISNIKCFSPNKNPKSKSKINQTSFYNLDYQKWIIGKYDNNSQDFFIILKSDNLFLYNSEAQDNNPQYLELINKNSKNKAIFQFQLFSRPLHKCLWATEEEIKYEKYKENIQKMIEHRYLPKIVLPDMSDSEDATFCREYLENCSNLVDLEIPNTYIDFDEQAFEYCTRIKTIKMHPKWLKYLPNPKNVENIVVPFGVEVIESDYFKNLHNLKYLSLPRSLNYDNCKQNAFVDIYGLTIFEGDPIFLNIIHKDALTKLYIPSFVKEIPEEACDGCRSLKEVHFENSSNLTNINSRAFADCKCLRYFVVPESVENIAPDAFDGHNTDFDLVLSNENQRYSMIDNLIIDPTKTDVESEYKLYINISCLEIPLEASNCETDIFKKFEKLKYVKCHPKWLNLFIPENIEIVFIPDQVVQLEKQNFEKLINLKFVEIPESVEEIEKGTFDNCKELTSIKCGTKHFKHFNQKQIKTISLNEQVTRISICDFEGFTNLETCIIPNSIQYVSSNVFANCKKLMNVEYPKGKSLINNSVTIFEDQIEILKEEFEGWTNLEKLIIPSSVTKIEEDAFKDCVNLKYVTCDPKWFPFLPKKSIRKIVIPDFVKEIKKGQFNDFYSMVCIKLPKEIEIDDERIFDSCESLKIIKCKASIFAKLSDKTIDRCDKKIKQKHENPIFNFQPNPLKVHDETGLNIPSDFDETLTQTFSNTIFSTLTTTMRTQRKTSVDDLVALDPNVNKYRNYINNVLCIIQSGEIKPANKPKDTSITEISSICGYVFYQIRKSYNVIPRIGQIYSVLYLADEILNNKESHGSIAEVKSGEGKTFIITVLAIILVKYGRTVDIIKSNLSLAKSDRYDQDEYFKLFHIDTSTFYDKRTDDYLLSKSANFKSPEYFNEFKGYDKSEFSKFNLQAFECPVVYSTNRNFEYYYLHTLFSMIPRKRPLDIVLIDEVDNMLIDELDSPANISKEINFSSARNIFCIVYSTRFMKVKEIADLLKEEFPNEGEFDEVEVELLRNAALEADNKIKDVDYIVNDNKIVIIDHNTGYLMPSSHWQNYVHEMVEIKEYIVPGPASITFCQVTQQSYFNLYKKIAGVTGTIGTEADEKILKEGYNVNCLRIPRNEPSKVEVYYKVRPDNLEDIYDLVSEEIIKERMKKRPILVIWDSKFNAKKFLESSDFKKFNLITGENPDADERSIETAGMPKALTISTLAASRNIEIKLTEETSKIGGLHVIIPMRLSNLRSLEQAVGRTGRYGQLGSVTIFISPDDLYIQTPQFHQGNENLVKLELRFAEYIRTNFPWLLCGPGTNTFGDNITFPFAASYSVILNIFARGIFFTFTKDTDLNKFQDLAWIMVQTSWGVFFTHLLNDKINNDNWTYCEREYNRFINELNVFISPTNSTKIKKAIKHIKLHFLNEKNKDFIIYKGIKISPDKVELIKSFNRNQSSSDLIDESKKKGFSLIPSGIKKLKSTYDWIKQKYEENKKLIPNKTILDRTSNIELENMDIDFIKMTMTLAKEAYNCGEFSIGRVIFGCETNELFKPKFYCVEHLNKLFVVTKGSSKDVDFLTDISCYEQSENINGNDYYFHNGFYTSAKYIISNITEFLERDYEEIYFVGHSLGAAVSNVLCFLAKTNENFKNKKIYSMAFAPPPSMSRIPAYVQDCMYSFINKEDIIPHLSLSNILNTVDLRQISLPSLFDSFLRMFKLTRNERLTNLCNFLENYREEILKTFQSVHTELHVRKNIGNIFFIGFSDSTELRNYLVDETDLQNTIFVPPSLITHHFMDEYIKTFTIIKSY